MTSRYPLAFLFALPALAGHAQFWAEQVIPPPQDVTATAQFGWSISVDGDYLLVGAPGSDADGPNTGAAYIFRREEGGTNDWDLLTRLAPPQLSYNARFGSTVLLRNGRAFVAAPSDLVGGISAGAVYTFDQHTGGENVWGYHQRLVSPVIESDLRFGSSMTIGDSVLVIGVPGLNDPQSSGGSPDQGGFIAFSPEPNGTMEAICVSFIPRAGGSGLIFGDNLVYSAAFEGSGPVTYTGYTLDLDSLSNPMNEPIRMPQGDFFQLPWPEGDPWIQGSGPTNYLCGPQMARSGQHCAIADAYANEPDIPLIILLSLDNNQAPHITGFVQYPEGLSEDARFGRSLALNCCDLAVGAPGTDIGSPVGRVLIYDTGDTIDGALQLTTVLYPTDPSFGDLFGWSLASQDGMLAVGAPGHGPSDEGRVHIFFDPVAGLPTITGSADPLIHVWPNPAGSFIEVRCSGPMGDNHLLELIDMTGRSASRMFYRNPTQRIDLGQVAPGSYLLRLVDGRSGQLRACVPVMINR